MGRELQLFLNLYHPKKIDNETIRYRYAHG
jgi:hypothetical protein